MKRRDFLYSTGISFPLLISASGSLFAAGARELKADVVILGGGLGGCAAALGALRNGFRVILTEETDWIGGQITIQGVPPDENPWIEIGGGTALYSEYRKRVREYYLSNYPVVPDVDRERFNPGGCGVSRICHEPKVALAVLEEMLAPYQSNKQLLLLTNHRAVQAEVEKDRVLSVTVQNSMTGDQVVLQAPYFLDATETGDLLPMTKTEFVTGAESKEDTGELHAAERANPNNMQAVTWCFAMDYIESGDFTIDRPANYDFWREYVPELTPAWPGKLLSWTYSHPPTLEPRTMYCDPVLEAKGEYRGFWLYRRMIAQKLYQEGFYQGDICLVNWPQNDYMLGNPFGGTEEENRKHEQAARELSLCLFYWMQTEAPRMDGKQGWKGLRLRGDVLGTSDGLAKRPYIRESRRIVPEFRVLEQHVGQQMRMEETGLEAKEVQATPFSDSVGIGYYRIDLHPSTGGDNYIDFASLPFQIPLGALIPQRMENLLPANKNIGTTHITNGCYRLHPVEWNIGESAGALAAYCLKNQETPRGVRNQEQKLEAFQKWIQDQGIIIAWEKEILQR
jgi:hypothetical protein